jgi:hypothetical protein
MRIADFEMEFINSDTKHQNCVTNEFFAHRKDAPACPAHRQAGGRQEGRKEDGSFALAVKGRQSNSLRLFEAKVLF